MQTATFGMGCFWSPQLLFSETKGILKTEVGYMGGAENKKSYSYEEICSQATGHAEVVQIKFDEKKISYKKILNLFFENHDATQINRQGPDIGSQYRSVIFYNDDEQKKVAEKTLKDVEKKLKKKVATKIIKAGKFYKAEDYHQNYLKKRGMMGCHAR